MCHDTCSGDMVGFSFVSLFILFIKSMKCQDLALVE